MCLTQGAVGFKGARRGTNFAGQEAGAEAARVSDVLSLKTPIFLSHVYTCGTLMDGILCNASFFFRKLSN